MKSFAVAALAGIVAATPMEPIEFKFINYIAKHNKTYATKEEYKYRMELFAEQDAKIQHYNETEKTSVHAHNFLSDMTDYEKSRLNGFKADSAADSLEIEDPEVGVTPDWTVGVNWVTAGAVAPVKDQGQCGSCWAFSAVSTLESAYHIAMNKGTQAVTQFAEQQAVSCVKSCFGCGGGW